ncbi:MAG: hypothetical protein ACI8TP_004857 [Acidimicrobiales bacterium]|jgi:hypothetical protein
MAVSRLRSNLPPNALPQGNGRYRLDLPTEMVDCWLLQHLVESTIEGDALTERCSDRIYLDLLRASHPYADVELSSTLRLAFDRVVSYRTTLFEKLVASKEPIDALLRDELRSVALADLLNERLVLLSARADKAAGQGQRAARTLELCSDHLHSELQAELDPELLSLSDELHSRANSRADQIRPAALLERAPFPPQLANQMARPNLGRESLISSLVRSLTPDSEGNVPRCLVLTGASGLGKSQVAAAVATALYEQGAEVRYGEADPDSQVAFAPLATMSSSVFKNIAGLVTSELDPHLRTMAIWANIVQFIDSMPHDRHVILVVDDIQWLDTQTRELLLFLTRSPLQVPLSLIVVASDDVGSPSLPQLRASLASVSNSIAQELKPYDRSDVAALIDSRFGDASTALRADLSDELLELSGGNPAIARTILGSVDPVTLRPGDPMTLGPERGLVDLVRALPETPRSVGCAAAVIGRRFDVERICLVAGLDEADVLSGLEHLASVGLAAELPGFDQFRFQHIFVQRAFEAITLRARSRRLHATAAETASTAHERARHLAAACPLIDPAIAVAALSDSARIYLDGGNPSEALDALRRAHEVGDDPLPLEAMILYAAALDLTGATQKAARLRRSAFDSAITTADWSLAAAAALSGLPGAERAEGDPERLDLLTRLPLRQLEDETGFALTLTLARQSFLMRRFQSAEQWARLRHENRRFHLRTGPSDHLDVVHQTARIDRWH